MLRRIRILFAAVCFLLLTALFLDFTGTLHPYVGWLAKLQFWPAVLALNVGVVILLVLMTLLLGRVYCSVICPLGVFQDVVSWLSSRRKKKKYRFCYSPAKRWLRYVVLLLFVVSALAGLGAVVALISPYSAYGRMAQNLLAPLYGWGNNLLAGWAEQNGSYAFYRHEVWLRSVPTLIVAVVTFLVLVVLAWRSGRTYCNTICPVGTLLGFLSDYSLFRPMIDVKKCNSCSLCSRQCKASCINPAQHTIDYSRCVACMDCIGACKHGAISYRLRNRKGTPQGTGCPSGDSPVSGGAGGAKGTGESKGAGGRRLFLTGAGLLMGSAALQASRKKVDGGLAVILDKQKPERRTSIVPPGAEGLRHFYQHCTACQLCVAVCPNQVLRPSTSLSRVMQPESSYEKGYCRPECTKCSEVCPTGAIQLVSLAEKSSIQIGHAVWVEKNCLPAVDGTACGNCARHCPVGAITMVPKDPADDSSARIPVVNDERCIGCGACENLCPARPFSAIYVEGHEQHKFI